MKTYYVETKEAISKIKAMSIHVVMLTGDNESVAKRIANEGEAIWKVDKEGKREFTLTELGEKRFEQRWEEYDEQTR